MSSEFAAWLVHPVTLGLAAAAVAALFVVIELLLRSLSQLGNVRFQGILEEHPELFNSATTVHVSRLIDVLRWIQLGCLGLLWLVVFRFPGLESGAAAAVALALPIVLVVAARSVVRPLSEDTATVLLRSVRPLASPLVGLMVRVSPEASAPPAEDEEEEASEAEIQAYLEAGEAAGIFEGDEGEIVESLVDFFDTVVREVMTPRTEMIAVADTDSYRELLEVFAKTHKSRIPVYHETIDRITGVVHVKNLVKHGLRGAEPGVADLARDCLVVPESGTSGLVTLEDILEEIVGEIQDELDPREPPDCQELSPGVYRLQGRAPLEVLEEVFGIEVAEDDMDTVGGLVFARHGTVPAAGTEVVDEPHGLHFNVDEMDERRIVSVTVRRADELGEGTDE